MTSELNPRAVEAAVQALAAAEHPVRDTDRADIAEWLVADTQDLLHRHGPGFVLRMAESDSGSYALHREARQRWDAIGSQIDGAFRAAAIVLWEDA